MTSIPGGGASLLSLLYDFLLKSEHGSVLPFFMDLTLLLMLEGSVEHPSHVDVRNGYW
jgi:hypothetical protein